MTNLSNYSELQSKLQAISTDWKSKESFCASNNIAYGSAGHITIEMIGSNWNTKKSVGCTKDYNSYGRKIWKFFSTSTNAMVDELAEELKKEIQNSGITDLKISAVLI
jgi:hypothetical protein